MAPLFVTGLCFGGGPSSGLNTDTYATAVAVDSSGNAYVTGETGSGFATTPGALNQGGGGDYGNDFNIFLVKFTPAGGLLLQRRTRGGRSAKWRGRWSRCFRGALGRRQWRCVWRGRQSMLWPISSDAYLKKITGGNPYATPFVTEVAPDAKSLIYSTYLDYAYVVTGIAVLPNGNVFVTGDSVGASYPTTANAYQQNSGNGGAAFLTELNSTGSALVYSTVIGDSS